MPRDGRVPLWSRPERRAGRALDGRSDWLPPPRDAWRSHRRARSRRSGPAWKYTGGARDREGVRPGGLHP
ncbi:hypothetical protein ACFZDQ_10250, partial [Streptococcus suis]